MPKTCPSRRKFAEGWMIPKPEQVIYMADKNRSTCRPRASSTYQMFVVDPGWKEDKWITADRAASGQSVGRASHFVVRACRRMAT